MISPTDMLEAEHRVIGKIVLVASILADRLVEGRFVEADILQRIVDFMRIYADKYHHGKEEQLLFPLLVKRGVPTRGCPIEALLREHVLGRNLVTGLSEATFDYQRDGSAAKEILVQTLRGLVDLYTNHIWKEDYLLFPMTNKVLGSEYLVALSKEFEKVEQAIGLEAHENLERFANELYTSLA